MTEYRHGDETLLVFVNRTNTPLSFQACGRTISLEADGVECVLA
jgi:hypothetical protein